MVNKILFGDCRETLKTIDTKARMCVTSPPYYGLRNYGGEDKQIGMEQTPEEYIEQLVDVFFMYMVEPESALVISVPPDGAA